MSDCNKPIEFNLLDEGWIRVLLPDCTVREVSLPDALIHAHEYVDLAGEMPTQDVAVLRLLLAVLHTVFSCVDPEGESDPLESTGEALRRWKVLWEAGQFPEKPIREYLNEWRDRFWLFHPERPFWQVPEAIIGTEGTAAKLNGEMMESNNKLRLFPSRSGHEKSCVSYPEAARWLLHLNGFDDTAAKPKGKDLPSPGAGWLGKLGLIICAGETLFETLMLNLVLFKSRENEIYPAVPCWESEEIRKSERTEIAIPDNQAALFTLQSRRLLLKRNNDTVTGYCLLGGDFFAPDNMFEEPMTVWRAVKEKGEPTGNHRPARHDPSIQMWREFPTLFVQQEGQNRPGVVEWIELLRKRRCIDRTKMIRFRAIGTQYGDKDFFMADIFSDDLSFSADLLSEKGMIWQRRITAELALCEKAAFEIKRLAKCINQAAGNDKGGSPERAEEQFYDRLNLPFRLWLEQIDLDEQSDMDPICAQWRDTAFRIASELGRELISQAGPAAVIGRSVKEGKKGKEESVYRSAPDAYNYFRYKIAKTFKIQKEENR